MTPQHSGGNFVTLSSDIQFYDAWHERPVLAQDALAIWERHALLRKLLTSAEGPLLVVGCGGSGEMSVAPCDMRATGVDISFVAVEQSRSRFPQHTYVVADAVHLPFKACQFKTIVCSEVIEHIRNSDLALAEFCRVLGAHERLVLTTPNWLSFYGLARVAGRFLLRKDLTSGDQSYDRWSTKRSLETQLKRAGFCPRTWLGFWFFPPFGKGRYRLPDWLIVPLLRGLMPIDRLLRSVLPSLGHVLCVVSLKCKPRQ